MICIWIGAASAETADRARLPVLPTAAVWTAGSGDLPLPQQCRLQGAAQLGTGTRSRQSPARGAEEDRRGWAPLRRRTSWKRQPPHTGKLYH